MPIEQRVVSNARPTVAPTKIGARPRTPEPEPTPAEEPKKKSKLKLIIAVVLVVVIAAGAGYWFFLRPSSDATGEPPALKEGEVHQVESLNVNLADGHYLRLGFAIQLSTKAKPVDEARILDVAIAEYSGKKFSDILDPNVREALKQQLAATLDELYEGQVMDVYLTDYVAQ